MQFASAGAYFCVVLFSFDSAAAITSCTNRFPEFWEMFYACVLGRVLNSWCHRKIFGYFDSTSSSTVFAIFITKQHVISAMLILDPAMKVLDFSCGSSRSRKMSNISLPRVTIVGNCSRSVRVPGITLPLKTGTLLRTSRAENVHV